MNRLAKTCLSLLALVLLVAQPRMAAAQVQIFSTGKYGTPETISLAPPGFGAFGGGYYFIPDARTNNVWYVPVGGGSPTEFLSAPLGTDIGILLGGLFLPSGWGANTGKLLIAGFTGMWIVDASGNATRFGPAYPYSEKILTMPVLAPAGFGSYGGRLFMSDQWGIIWLVDSADGSLTMFKDTSADPTLDYTFGLEFTPPGFGKDGEFGNLLLTSQEDSGTITALAADGTLKGFADVPLAPGQVGGRQLLIAPDDYFKDSLGITGPTVLFSISGSQNGGGTKGSLVVLGQDGSVAGHLVTGTDEKKFDPRGMLFTADGHLLVSDTSDPILSATAADFLPGLYDVPALSPAHLWIGLRNSDDQGTQFDLKVELLVNGDPVASGLARCITGLTRNPTGATEVVVPFADISPVPADSGDVLAFRVSTRIGTNANGTKCSGPGGSHGAATGLRLYYGAPSVPSHFDAVIAPNPNETLYMHSDGGYCSSAESAGVTDRYLDGFAPVSVGARCKDSGPVNIAGGNPFSIVGSWELAPLP